MFDHLRSAYLLPLTGRDLSIVSGIGAPGSTGATIGFCFLQSFTDQLVCSRHRYRVAIWFSLLLIFPLPSRLGIFTRSSPKLKSYRLREHLAITLVKTLCKVTGHFQVLLLVFTYRYFYRTVNQNIGTHQHRIS